MSPENQGYFDRNEEAQQMVLQKVEVCNQSMRRMENYSSEVVKENRELQAENLYLTA